MSNSGSTRREFVKKSFLVGATVALAGAAARASAAPTPATDKEAPGTFPVTPYGSGEPIYLADLGNCQPASALSAKAAPNRWRLIPFEAELTKGDMLVAGQNTAVPEVSYPLKHTGWYAIHFGIYSEGHESRLQVRLSSDSAFTLLTPNSMAKDQMVWDELQFARHNYTSDKIEELFWKHAELESADTSLLIRQLQVQTVPGDPLAVGNCFSPCWLAYIKLVPLAAAEVTALQADRARRDTRRLFATDDAFTAPCYLHFKTEDDIRREVEPYRNTDFARMYWEAGMGDLTYYPSKVGKMITMEWMGGGYIWDDRIAGEVYRDFHAQGIDPFRVALDACHGLGLEFHASYRVAGFHFPPPDNNWNEGGMYDQHAEWRCVDRAGRPEPRLSYAFPGVREFVLKVLAEVAEYPVDGICLLFNRRLPILGYEAPLVESFQAKYGVDPRKLDERDPRWLEHSAAVLTDFMRELRARMRAKAARSGKKAIGITAVVMGSKAENYGYGVDVEAWVKEHLIDTLVPYTSVAGGNSRHVSWDDPHQADFFIRLTKGTPCKLALNLLPRAIEPEDYKRRADALYAAGVDYLYFWDCFERTNFDASWSALRRLGHREELADWRKQGRPAIVRPGQAVLRLGDWTMSYGTPG